MTDKHLKKLSKLVQGTGFVWLNNILHKYKTKNKKKTTTKKDF